jgi:hypothetical protein
MCGKTLPETHFYRETPKHSWGWLRDVQSNCKKCMKKYKWARAKPARDARAARAKAARYARGAAARRKRRKALYDAQWWTAHLPPEQRQSDAG